MRRYIAEHGRALVAFAAAWAIGAVLIWLLIRAIDADHWLFHPLFGRGYQFWSGVAGCFVSLGLVTGLATLAKHHNCGVKGCWRLGHPHPHHGRPVCGKHFCLTPHVFVKHHGAPRHWSDARTHMGLHD